MACVEQQHWLLCKLLLTKLEATKQAWGIGVIKHVYREFNRNESESCIMFKTCNGIKLFNLHLKYIIFYFRIMWLYSKEAELQNIVIYYPINLLLILVLQTFEK